MPICQYIKTFILGISLGIERVKEAMIFKAELHSLTAYQSLDLLSTYFQRIFQYLRRCLHRTKKRTRRKSKIWQMMLKQRYEAMELCRAEIVSFHLLHKLLKNLPVSMLHRTVCTPGY